MRKTDRDAIILVLRGWCCVQGNTMKRVAVVASSVLFFRNPVSVLNWAGSLIAIAGTGLYGIATDKAANEAKAKAA